MQEFEEEDSYVDYSQVFYKNYLITTFTNCRQKMTQKQKKHIFWPF